MHSLRSANVGFLLCTGYGKCVNLPVLSFPPIKKTRKEGGFLETNLNRTTQTNEKPVKGAPH
jgi:hypothetical protein